MPRIVEYNAPATGLQPSEIGVESTAAAARRIGTFFHQTGGELSGAIREATGAAQKYLDYQEISHGAVGMAAKSLQQVNKLNKVASESDPNDPTVVGKFMNEFEADMQPFVDSFKTEAGQTWAREHADSLRTHLLTHISAEMATRSGQEQVNNVVKVGNTLATAGYNDPSMLPNLFEQADSIASNSMHAPYLTGEQSGKLNTEVRTHLKSQIVTNVLQGLIDRGDTEKWREIADDPKYAPYIDKSRMHGYQQQQESVQRSIRVSRIQEENETRRLQEDKTNKDAWNVLNKNMQIDPNTGKMNISPFFVRDMRIAMQDNKDSPNAAKTFESGVRWVEERNRTRHEDIVTDPATHDDLLGRMYNETNPTSLTQIWDMEARGKLNPKDATPLLQLVQARQDIAEKDPAMRTTLKGAQDRLNSYGSIPGTKIKMEMGSAYADFLRRFSAEYLKRQQAGTLEPNALNLTDPNSLIRQMLDQFKPKPGEIMQDFNDRFGSVGGIIPGGGSIMSGGTSPAVPAQPVPTQSFINLPPKDKLEVGKSYPTSQGVRTWTGTGFK